MRHSLEIESLGSAAVVWQRGPRHKFYEDRFRMLCRPIPLVTQAERGELFAVLDGVGSAPKGMNAAQEVADVLVKFFDAKNCAADGLDVLQTLLQSANRAIHDWGMIPETTRPEGACAGTVVWIDENWKASVFHAGDTSALLIRDGIPHQLTSVHQNAEGHLSNYFGMTQLRLDVRTIQLEEGDRVLIFSDGIGKAFSSNQKVVDIVEAQPTRQTSLSTLLIAARSAGSSDDATAILVDVEDNS